MIGSTDILQAGILIVDDQQANVSLLEQMLAGAGYGTVTSTRDPREVCHLHGAHRYDLILLDLQMPGMDGFQVMEGLKEIETDAVLPVLVITAQPDHKLRALRAGARDFVSKPFDLAEVLVRVHNLIEVRLLNLQLARHNYVRLENSQRIAGLGDWECDQDNHRLVWSDGVYQILGLDRTAFPPSEGTFERLVHPEDRAFVQREQQAAARGLHRAEFDHRIIRPDGQVRHFHQIIEHSPGEPGRPARDSGTMQDVTERKLADCALRQSEERFRKLLLLSPDAQFVDDGERITLVNPSFCRLMGASEPAQLLGRPTLELVHPHFHELVRKRRQLDLADRALPPSEMRLVRLDGTEVEVEIASAAVESGGRHETLMIARDITERKRLAEHFLQAQKMEALGQFSGGVAHDFNNILAVIAGYTELAEGKAQSLPEVVEHLRAVLRASNRAVVLVRQILTFSRQHSHERRPILLQPIVEEGLRLLRVTMPSTIEFELAVAANAPPVLADANQIHQILMNLGTNACHAMQDRPGRLMVKLERCEVDAAQASTEPRLRPGLYARISVGDTGCGMDQGTQRRIFDPFFTTKPPGEGTGLGLAVVHGIMDSHDGAITVYSQPGEGSVFHLYFPAHAGDAAAIAPEDGPVPRGRGERVLVVDDEELLAELGQKTLATLGYEAEFVTHPAAALALVNGDPHRFALVLTDHTMPGMTGLQLASRLRQTRPDLPILLMSGYTASLTPERIAAAGISQLLLKPVSLHMLGSAVHAALSASTPTPSWPASSLLMMTTSSAPSCA